MFDFVVVVVVIVVVFVVVAVVIAVVVVVVVVVVWQSYRMNALKSFILSPKVDWGCKNKLIYLCLPMPQHGVQNLTFTISQKIVNRVVFHSIEYHGRLFYVFLSMQKLAAWGLRKYLHCERIFRRSTRWVTTMRHGQRINFLIFTNKRSW